jgi:hypothetical protein
MATENEEASATNGGIETPTPNKNKTRKRVELPPKDETVKEEVIGDEKPKRTYNRKKKAGGVDVFSPEAISNLSKQIEGLHIIGAQMSGIPEIALSGADSQALAMSIIAVCSQYDLSIDGKTGALLQLLGTTSFIYLPRYFAFKNRTTKMAVEDVV